MKVINISNYHDVAPVHGLHEIYNLMLLFCTGTCTSNDEADNGLINQTDY